MFNWTTTTIINSTVDAASKKALFAAVTDGTNKILRIKRDHVFQENWIEKVYYKEAEDFSLCEMEVNTADLLDAIKEYAAGNGLVNYPVTGRLAFYIALEGSEEHIYANDWYQKGKPFAIGFSVNATTTAAGLAKQIKRNAEHFGVVMYGKKIFDLEVADDGTLTIKGTHEYQRIKAAAALIDENIEEYAIAHYVEGAPDNDEIFTLVNRGINGFGTYDQLVKDLRLPTVHHTKWLRTKSDETPIVGAKYNQYIITYCAPSMANPAFTTIGERNMSVTTHVFWVNQAIVPAWDAVLKAVLGNPVNDAPGVTGKFVKVAGTAELNDKLDGTGDSKSFGKARELTLAEPKEDGSGVNSVTLDITAKQDED